MNEATLGVGSEATPELKLKEAVHVKSAELWLRLGQPVEALLELQKLPALVRNHPWACKVMRKAFRMVAARVRCLS